MKAIFALFLIAGGASAQAEVACTGTITAKNFSKVVALTPSSSSERLTAYLVDKEGVGYTFVSEQQGGELVLKIIPDEEKPLLKQRVNRQNANVTVSIGVEANARLNCKG